MLIEKITRNAALTIAAIYATIVLLFSFPAMQGRLANWIADVLSEQLETKVSIRSASIGLLNRIIINDVIVNDRNGAQMLSVARMSVAVNYLPFLVNKIDIPTAQIYGARALIYRDTPDSPTNIQFVIDAFSSEDNEEKSAIDLRLNSLIVRHAYIKYDVRSEQHKPQLDFNHIKIHDTGFNLSIKTLNEDSINIRLRRFSTKELNSGLSVHSLNMCIEGNNDDIWFKGLSLAMPHSTLDIDTVHLRHQAFDFSQPFATDSINIKAELYPCDFAALVPALKSINKSIAFSSCILGSDKGINISDLTLSTDAGATSIHTNAHIDLQKDSVGKLTPVAVSIPNLNITTSQHSLASILHDAAIDSTITHPILHAGDIQLQSSLYAKKVNGNDFALNTEATLNTSVGRLACVAELSTEKVLDVMLQDIDLNLGNLLGNESLGRVKANATATLQLGTKHELPVGDLTANINLFEYKGYRYTAMAATAKSRGSAATINLNSQDPNADLNTDIEFAKNDKLLAIEADMNVNRLNPHALNLTEKFSEEDFAFSLSCDLDGSNIDNMRGALSVEDLIITTPDSTYTLSSLNVTAKDNDMLMGDNACENASTTTTTYTIESDFLNAELEGTLKPSLIPTFITNTLSHNLSRVIESKDVDIQTQDCSFHASIRDSRLVRHLSGIDCILPNSILIAGNLDSKGKNISMTLSAPQVIYSGTDYRDIDIHCTATNDSIIVNGILSRVTEKDNANAKVHACAIDNNIQTQLDFGLEGVHTLKAVTNTSIQFSDSIGKLLTSINFNNSTLNIDSTDWAAPPSSISIFGKEIACNNLRVQNDDSYIIIDGKASPDDNEALLVDLNNIDVEYVLNLINYHSLDFGGFASGKATVRNVFGTPDLLARLDVRGFKFQGGSFGNAGIDVKWNRRTHGIEINANFTDDYEIYTSADSKKKERIMGLTSLIGYVSPDENFLDLRLQTNRTNAEFLNGFLDGIFSDINGYLSGPISVVGPFSEVDVIGDAYVTLNATLLSTNVTYHMENQRLKMTHGKFDFSPMLLTDRNSREVFLTGNLTHCGFDDIDYDFNIDVKNALCYEELDFNSDHFYGTIYGTGNVSINGKHDSPLYINANVTTEPNSVFAYDAWTPESGGNASFITFRDKLAPKDTLKVVEEQSTKHNSVSGSMYIDCNLNLNNNCKVMLRLDNTSEEGYITVRGTSPLQIKYYNKGAFEIFGNYAIESGNYRLYLQNPIYKDLAIQSGSNASFNGNPFNAKVHLNCKHTINSVPLSDLTVSTGTGQRNDVRVECLLDITGNLSKLDLDFGLNLPTASDETRQLVNSMINTDEEMNRQIIYLLAIGRFYPNEYARANSTSNNSSSAAVSSFVSSTISGQINNMLGSLMGNNSNWNVGAGFSAGERGWQDMGVEGSLSGRLFDDRLLINGVFGYRDNVRTNTASFIGDFEVKWRLKKDGGNMYLKAYNQTNDRYFTKSTINTQGIGINYQRDFDSWRNLFRKPLLIKQ